MYLKLKLTLLMLFLVVSDISMQQNTTGSICLISCKNRSKRCEKKCHGEFSFSCGAEHCTRSKGSCKNFLKLTYVYKSLSQQVVNTSSDNILEMRNPMNYIKPCPLENSANQKSGPSCISAIDCDYKQAMYLRWKAKIMENF